MMLYKLVVLGDGGVGKVCTSRNLSFEIIAMWLITHLHCSSDRIDHPGRLSNSPFSVGSPQWAGLRETESEEAQCHQSNGIYESWEKKCTIFTTKWRFKNPPLDYHFFEKTAGLYIEAGLCVQLCSWSTELDLYHMKTNSLYHTTCLQSLTAILFQLTFFDIFNVFVIFCQLCLNHFVGKLCNLYIFFLRKPCMTVNWSKKNPLDQIIPLSSLSCFCLAPIEVNVVWLWAQIKSQTNSPLSLSLSLSSSNRHTILPSRIHTANKLSLMSSHACLRFSIPLVKVRIDTPSLAMFHVDHCYWLLLRAEEYTALRDQWIRDGEGFLLVYSISSRSTFERVERFRDQIFRVKDVDKVPLMLVGNKCDKVTEREVSREEGCAMAKRLSCDFIETSAKTCVNVERSFYSVVRMIRANREGGYGHPGGKKKNKEKKKCLIL